MALNASKVASSGGSAQSTIDPGVYPGRLVQVLDLGLQAQRPFQGKDKPPIQEIMLTYELSDEFMKDEDGEDILDKPRWVIETIPLHHLKADRAKSTLRYNALDPSGAFGGDFTQCLGIPINITIVNNENQGKTYTNVAGIAPMRPRDAQKLPELVNPTKFFDLDSPDMEIFASLPDWIKEKIQKNLNYEGSKLQGILKGKPAPAKAAKKADQVDEADDVPY